MSPGGLQMIIALLLILAAVLFPRALRLLLALLFLACLLAIGNLADHRRPAEPKGDDESVPVPAPEPTPSPQ
jgi:hypothetical protein